MPDAEPQDLLTRKTVQVGDSSYEVDVDGDGPAVLLLHGFPENRHCRRKVAPELSRDYAVVLCDIKGYGDSRAPAGGPLGEGYSKREMAGELVQVMTEVGYDASPWSATTVAGGSPTAWPWTGPIAWSASAR